MTPHDTCDDCGGPSPRLTLLMLWGAATPYRLCERCYEAMTTSVLRHLIRGIEEHDAPDREAR